MTESEYKKILYQNSKEKRLLQMREYYKRNREKLIQYQRDYRKRLKQGAV